MPKSLEVYPDLTQMVVRSFYSLYVIGPFQGMTPAPPNLSANMAALSSLYDVDPIRCVTKAMDP